MLDHEKYMQIAIDYAKKKNPIWPYATLIVNEKGEILIQASNAVHISPTFHGEMVALNALAKEFKNENLGALTLYTTGECCTMCQSAIHWANVMGFKINTTVFGSTIPTMQKLWGHEIEIHSRQVVANSSAKTTIIGPVLEKECDELFTTAKKKQEEIANKYKPTWEDQSWNIEKYYETPPKPVKPELNFFPKSRL